MQFCIATHQTKKGKHESNTSDVLRTGEGQTATRDQELLSLLRRLDAGGEKLEEFGAINEERVKCRGWIDKFAVAQKIKPVLGLSRFLECDLELPKSDLLCA